MDKKIAFSGLAISLAAFMALADSAPTKRTSDAPQKASSARIIFKEAEKLPTQRPKAPSRQVIECDYDGAYLTFSFTVPAGECEAAVTEWYSGATQTYTIDSSDLTAAVYVGQLYESTVTLTTAASTTYAADLTAN